MNDLPTLAVGNARASHKSQLNSLPVQREQIESYCKFRQFECAKVFEDHISGRTTKFFDRPANKEMLQFCKDTGCTHLVFTKVDRLGRTAVDIEHTYQELTRQGFALHLLNLQVDTSTAMGKAMMQMSAVFAELEVAMARERKAETQEYLRRESRRLGTIPYGHRLTDPDDKKCTQLEPCPQEQHNLLLIKNWIDEGLKARAIARKLQEHGILTKKGLTSWSPGTVSGIIERIDSLLEEAA